MGPSFVYHSFVDHRGLEHLSKNATSIGGGVFFVANLSWSPVNLRSTESPHVSSRTDRLAWKNTKCAASPRVSQSCTACHALTVRSILPEDSSEDSMDEAQNLVPQWIANEIAPMSFQGVEAKATTSDPRRETTFQAEEFLGETSLVRQWWKRAWSLGGYNPRAPQKNAHHVPPSCGNARSLGKETCTE